MNPKLEKKLISKFPKLFSFYEDQLERLKKGDPFLPIAFGIGIGDGWYGLMEELCDKLSVLDEDIQFTQIKEKWGQLRVYIVSGSDKAYDILDEIEGKSASVCEHCGDDVDGKLRDGGWTVCLCDTCYKISTEPEERRWWASSPTSASSSVSRNNDSLYSADPEIEELFEI